MSRARATELRVEFVSLFFGYKRILVHEFARPHKFAEVVSYERILVHEFARPHKFADCSKVTWNARQRIEPDSILSSDPKTSSEVLQELSKASAF